MSSMQQLRDCETIGVTRDSFESVFPLSFTTPVTGCSGVEVEVVPNGASRTVTFNDRGAYADAVIQYRLHEFDPQLAAVRKGLASIVPQRLLSVFTWREVEVMVCGENEIDVALLRSMTNYNNCDEDDAHVKFFWQVCVWKQRVCRGELVAPSALGLKGLVWLGVAAWRRC